MSTRDYKLLRQYREAEQKRKFEALKIKIRQRIEEENYIIEEHSEEKTIIGVHSIVKDRVVIRVDENNLRSEVEDHDKCETIENAVIAAINEIIPGSMATSEKERESPDKADDAKSHHLEATKTKLQNQ